jgi:hypothetical protein
LFNDKDKALEILNNGIYKDANVSAIIFTLIKYYTFLGYNDIAMKDTIFNWIIKQDITERELKKFDKYFNTSLTYIKENNPQFRDNIVVKITLEDMQQIHTLKNKSDKLVALAFIYVSRIFANEEGVFSCKHQTICKLTGLNFSHVRLSNTNMIKNNLLIPIQINKIKTYGGKNSENYGFVYSYPNKYKLNFVEGTTVIHNIVDSGSVFNDFIKCYYLCLTNYKFKVSRRFKRFLQINI